MKRPTPDAIRQAAEWCSEYEDDELAPVAAWLHKQADAFEEEAFIAMAVKEVGCSKAMARRKWREKQGA